MSRRSARSRLGATRGGGGRWRASGVVVPSPRPSPSPRPREGVDVVCGATEGVRKALRLYSGDVLTVNSANGGRNWLCKPARIKNTGTEGRKTSPYAPLQLARH